MSRNLLSSHLFMDALLFFLLDIMRAVKKNADEINRSRRTAMFRTFLLTLFIYGLTVLSGCLEYRARAETALCPSPPLPRVCSGCESP